MGIESVKVNNTSYPLSPLVFSENERVVGKLGNNNLISKMVDITSSVSIQHAYHDDYICVVSTEPALTKYNQSLIRFIKFTNSDNEVYIYSDSFSTTTISDVVYYYADGVDYDFYDGKTITSAIMGYVVEQTEND